MEPYSIFYNDLLIHHCVVPLLRWRRLTDKSKFENLLNDLFLLFLLTFLMRHAIIQMLIYGHRRQSTVALMCRIRCPSELGLLCLQYPSYIFWRKL